MHHKKTDFVTGGLLIAVGLMMLLNNLELVPWSFWNNVWKFWPVLLILFGLSILRKN